MPDKKTCKDCKFHRKLDRIGTFKCKVNNNIYTGSNPCFMFKEKTHEPK